MSLPTAYLTSVKNTEGIFQAIQAAQAPPRFTQKFLEGLGFANVNDRNVINVLKALAFLDDSGVPTSRYHEYLDQTQSAIILAKGVREAYADLFAVNKNANTLSNNEVKNKMKTLSAGQFSDRVLTQMASTFAALSKLADFSSESTIPELPLPPVEGNSKPPDAPKPDKSRSTASFGGLVYNINIHLPESRDPAVYDALFRSLKEHLG